MNIDHRKLTAVAERIFTAIGCEPAEAEIISKLLVTANLVGHDSHGVARIPRYVESVSYTHLTLTTTPYV